MGTDRTTQRDELVAAYRSALDGLLTATGDLDDAAWARETGCPGWSVHDQLAHCVGLERRLLGDPDLDPDVVVPDLPHIRDDIGRFIERDVEARRGTPSAELHAEAREAFARRLDQLGELRPDQLEEETLSLMGPMRTSRALRMRLFDLVCHERDIRAAGDRLDGLVGPHVAVGVEQALRSWARALPTRTEDGDTIRFVLDGDEEVDLDLGTGTLSRGESVAATVSATLRLSAADLLALAGGRADAPTLDQLPHDGDAGLLARSLAVAGVTP